MDKFITYKEQELKDNIKWVETYAESIIELCNNPILFPNNKLTQALIIKQNLSTIKLKAISILKQLEDFNLST
jgi:hypothetical protein